MEPVSLHVRSSESPVAAAVARQADPGLDRLLAVVLTERRAMAAELRVRPPRADRQMDVRGRLLASLEAYTAALASRGLGPPPKLRDELALQRGLARQRPGYGTG